ncbi:flagellar basal body P-ring formation chaperone FlgA [Halochromatium salexigens]|uniref:Flagella basal body P-ring formation protein FlgA n=1 Tax=Halochromatium salexigens TaxID=49447 RepID=A0AAJ0XF06_HALSE|nr:flagellar basal body P-ring formation chaperone FlgA [Halochromatium salexigens]MBK5929773.1 flagella basal body P-ring formation protein FlgA [Halochromatium salexigens]
MSIATPVRADEAMLQAVQAFLHEQASQQGEDLVIELTPPAAKLPPCRSPEPFLPGRSRSLEGRLSVGVRCGEQGRQVRYLQAEISRYGDYPVLEQELAPGTLVTAEMLTQRQGNLSDLPRDSVLEPESIIGQVARRTVRAGVPLQHRQFRAKLLVKRGQQVVVEARGKHFRVAREGEALDSGGLGERVRVRFATRELIDATVVGKARLAVDF